ncbi:MAG: MerR family transcriptional regulator [Pseudomonadota bacterium]
MAKARDAFRTISEVAETLDTPAHVLRFWESKFKQIKPVKRAGGRRYYRPDDLALLAAIKDLLHNQGNSIKDTQRLIREAGVKSVVADGHRLLDESEDASIIDAPIMPPPAPVPVAQPDLFAGTDAAPDAPPRFAPSDNVLEPDPVPSFARRTEAPAPAAAPAPEAKSATSLPPQPAVREDVGSRILANLLATDSRAIRMQRDKIAPIAEKLTALRDQLQQPW